MAQSDPGGEEFARLMAAANAGDSEAYARLLRALVPLVSRLVRSRRHLGNSADAEDIVQDVLLSVHSVRATYDTTRPFMPWLVAIVRHRTADAARREMRHAARSVELDETSVTFAAADANSFVEGFAEVDALRIALRDLPRRQRDAIELLKLQGLSLREASAVTRTTVGALKVATHRAMSTLRSVLKKHEH
jgi:RNA polymerase sigma factor (sigma-70 family)